ncbi:hypothetical protein WMY93_005336 [Mugilogobius chulae]|uniref:Septin-type G domain-containing protein n=1 Tax=Mugilogobius chulae TaxID=88201 RepID=A0AAW0PWY4_9GOBI
MDAIMLQEKLVERLLCPRVRTARQKEKQYVGFATLPNQVHRKSVKKGFDFTLMVAGESGMGKSTLVNSLFLTDLYKDRKLLNAEERINQTVEIIKHTVDIEEKGVKLKLTIVDTPGFGDAVNNNECWKPITDYIDQQFEQYFRDESGLNRKNIQDNRVHCCLYFIPPFGHGLRPVDVEFMKALHEKVNIIPLIAKADCLTPNEIKKLKDRECTPFAVIGSNTVVEARGQRVRGRLYPWGIVEVENQSHCDFVKLRNMLIRSHMHDLKDVTCDVHYENYRAQCIQEMTSKLAQDNRMESPIPILPLSTPDVETEKLIKMKDEELKRMQEMLNKMQQQMHDKEQKKKKVKQPLASAAFKQHQVKMRHQLFVVLLFFLLCEGQSSCPGVCSCHGGTVDCSGRSIITSSLPGAFPAGTTKLHLHNNMLTTLPNGLLDSLLHLRSVSLHGNPWVCDCGILYLRAWLVRHPVSHTSHLQVNCSSPLNLRGRLVVYLSEEELLDTCHYWYCDLALVSQLCLLGFVLLQGGLLFAVVVFLRRFQHMSKEARRTTEESFTTGEMMQDNEYTPLRDTSM